jgi:HSP20 family protein
MSSVLTRDLFGNALFSNHPMWTDSVSVGAYHQHSNENEIVIEVPLVGMSRENVTVEVVDNNLNVSAKTDNASRYTRNFSQSWILTKDSDTENITAKLENGLLKVHIPRVKPAKKVVNVSVV